MISNNNDMNSGLSSTPYKENINFNLSKKNVELHTIKMMNSDLSSTPYYKNDEF